MRFLLGRNSGLLAFEQGLGKTRVALESFRQLRTTGRADTLVVICPNSLKRNWAIEAARFTPELEVCIIQGPLQERRSMLSQTKAAVIVINYEGARNEVISIRALMGRTRSALVLDESHYVKNLRSLNSIAARHFAPLTEFRWLLSGTPVTNTPTDLYSQLRLVAGDKVFGPFDAFMAQYGDDKIQKQREELRQRIAPYVFRRTKDQCLDLPERTFVDLYVSLPAWQRQLYDEARASIVRQVRQMSHEEFAAFAPTALTRLLRLSQIASNPALVFPEEKRLPAKISELDRILTDLLQANERKIVVWSHYVRNIEILAQRYARIGAVTLYGGTPPEERQEVVRRFQEDPEVRVLIGNPAAGGMGFTLTAASYTIYESLSWRYDLYAQSQDRVHRIGQTTPVTYIRLISENTVDEVMAETLTRKAEMAQAILGDESVPFSVSEMTPEEFCTVLLTNRLPDSTATGYASPKAGSSGRNEGGGTKTI